jgi:hypothetical protein
LPVPLSPVINTVARDAATVWMSSRNTRMGSLRPTKGGVVAPLILFVLVRQDFGGCSAGVLSPVPARLSADRHLSKSWRMLSDEYAKEM